MTGLIAAEWLKFHSVRATRIVACVIPASIAGGAALTWYVADTWDKMAPADRDQVSIASVEEITLSVSQLCFAILGVLAMTAEYKTGLIRSTFTAVPSRRLVLAAKAIVLAATALVVGTATSVLTYLVCDAVIGERPIPYYDQPAEPAALLTAGPSTLVFAMIGLGLGTLMRSAAGAITAIVGLWYVLPIVALNLPVPWDSRVGSVLLTRLDAQLAGVDLVAKYGEGMPAALLSPLAAAIAMAAYIAAALIPATLTIRRDLR
ncbi:hypothetical protein AB0I28_07010 [Phytomonospora sp. NPDC050363]|uniref:hypothetical protein n=1 Tax=Phytomonospora sp. NPDC050363 TaxID=3155642 RepID=UPI0033C4668D